MSRDVVLDEWHLTFRIPSALSATQVRAIRRVLTAKAFTTALRRALLNAMKTYRTLKLLQLEVSR